MSYGIHAFSVGIAEVQQAVGSRDQGLIEEIREEFTSAFKRDADDDGDLDEDEEKLSLGEALEQLINGESLQAHFGHKYGYAMELLCWHFGELQPNDQFSGMRWEWVEQVDEALESARVDEKLLRLGHHLLGCGSPIRIPSPDDFPAIGYLKLSEIGPALNAVKSADMATIDPEAQESITQLTEWLETCLSKQSDLVCFYG